MDANNKHLKMQFLESVHNDIVNTIGSLPSESGGLLFGKEDDFVVRKFIFDKPAQVTRSSYTFCTEFLNPVIKKLWDEEGLSCIGFIHSHPYGYDRLSPPDMNYFRSMFEFMPRKKYLTPVVFTVPDGGFKINAHILPRDSKETILADIEILPDNFYNQKTTNKNKPIMKNTIYDLPGNITPQDKFDSIQRIMWTFWKLIMAYSIGYFILKALYMLTIHLNKIL